MRIFIPLCKGDQDVHNQWNPYVYTLTDYIRRKYSNTDFFFNVDLFNTEEVLSFDIIHIMWASIFFYIDRPSVYEDRLRYLKRNGLKIVSTCHNLNPHYVNNEDKRAFYEITYQMSDIIIHLGQASQILLKNRMPSVKNVIIPHHIYDTVYTNIKKRKTLVKYIACIGAFRDDEEIELVKKAGKYLFFTRYFILAPSLLVHGQWNRRNKLMLLKPLFKMIWLRWRYHIITFDRMWVDHESMVKYMNMSCISFIPRIINLNSGNLTLGFLFENVVIGPDTGNIGLVLQETGNPTFSTSDLNTLKSALSAGISQYKANKGKENKTYAQEHWSTQIVAEKHYETYRNILQKKV